MPHRDLGDAGPAQIGKYRNETVQLPVDGDALDHLPPVGLEGAAVIVDSHPGDPSDKPVGHPGGNFSGKPGVLPVFAPAGYHVVPLLELGQEQGDVGGIILEIRIQGDDDLSPGGLDAAGQSRALAEIAAQNEPAQPGIALYRLAQYFRGTIGGTVIHDDDLHRPPQLREHLLQTGQ